MFKNLSTVTHNSHFLLLMGVALVVFIVVTIGVWFFIRMRNKKTKSSPASSSAIPGSAVPDKPAQASSAPKVSVAATNAPALTTKVQLYGCICGAQFTKRELGRHFLTVGRQEPNQHKSMGKILSEQDKPGVTLKVGEKEPYRAVIWRYPRDNNESVIEFKQRINKPLGNLWYAEPSLPISGDCYYVCEKADGTFLPFDPRELPITSKYTPTQAYKATHWDLAEGVWVWTQAMLQKISTFIVFGLIFITFIIILVVVGGK
jgi:hypothetical protein